jgi:hypothetical protein
MAEDHSFEGSSLLSDRPYHSYTSDSMGGRKQAVGRFADSKERQAPPDSLLPRRARLDPYLTVHATLTALY